MTRAGALAACLLVSACASAGAPAPIAAAPGYLDAEAIGSLAEAASVPVSFDVNRPFPEAPGPDRWWLAIAHAELRPPEAAQHFDCVLGARLAGHPRPALTRLMNRLLTDADRLTRILAETATRPRPIKVIAGLTPCVRVNEAVRDTPSWPAGAAVVGSAYGELFAALAPDRAEGARRMGREIGLSRVVCRMNWPEDVSDGAVLGQQLYAAQSTSAGFSSDLEAARSEVAAARAEGLSNPGCAAERRALTQAGRGATSEP